MPPAEIYMNLWLLNKNIRYAYGLGSRSQREILYFTDVFLSNVCFQAVDQDGSGAITVNELQRALMHGDWTPFNEETCRLMIGMFDKDRFI